MTYWIASYPKSGNTWVRFLLHAAIFGPPKRSIDINANIPDIHRAPPPGAPDQPPHPQLRKTHFRWTPQHPLAPTTRGCIHITRNPRDVLRSALHFHTLNAAANPNSPPINTAAYAKQFIAHQGDPLYTQLGFGSWTQHTDSWSKENTDFPVIHIRYEDLKADPAPQLARMLDFLELPKDQPTIDAAVDAGSFTSMRALEEHEKHTDTPPEDRLFVGSKAATDRGLFFMNAARTAQPLDDIEPGLDAAFDNAFPPYPPS